MARIKLRLGDNEIEVDSRDFYVDNQTLPKIIDDIAQHLPENQAKVVYATESSPSRPANNPTQFGLEDMDDVEAFEPEFSEPKYISPREIKSKLRILETSKFFNSPRTVCETVSQLREYGWASSPLDVSKALSKMAFNKEIMKNSKENRAHYFVAEPLVN